MLRSLEVRQGYNRVYLLQLNLLRFLQCYSNIKTRCVSVFKVVCKEGDYNFYMNDRVYTRHVVLSWFCFRLQVAGCHTE